MSPTQRSLKLLRDRGNVCQVVERFNIYAKVRQDLFGVIDLVALHSSVRGVLGVQSTSGANVSARCVKIGGSVNARLWLKTGNRLMVHGWRKVGARGKRKLWECREVECYLRDGLIHFEEVAEVSDAR